MATEKQIEAALAAYPAFDGVGFRWHSKMMRAALLAAEQAGESTDVAGYPFWVVELIDLPRAPVPRYWGGNEVGFVYEICDAIQFCRLSDAKRFLKHTHIHGVEREHSMIAAAPKAPPRRKE